MWCRNDTFYIVNLLVAGFLTECYDELGTRYQVPLYCLSYPVNIVKEGNDRDSPSEIAAAAAGTFFRFDNLKNLATCINCDFAVPVTDGKEIILKIRLSHNHHDIKLALSTTDSIAVAKKKLQVRREGW